jgi:hypothetical protein
VPGSDTTVAILAMLGPHRCSAEGTPAAGIPSLRPDVLARADGRKIAYRRRQSGLRRQPGAFWSTATGSSRRSWSAGIALKMSEQAAAKSLQPSSATEEAAKNAPARTARPQAIRLKPTRADAAGYCRPQLDVSDPAAQSRAAGDSLSRRSAGGALTDPDG